MEGHTHLPIQIPSDADLNNYKTEGCYACDQYARSKTILNKPLTNDDVFALEVLNLATNCVTIQRFTTGIRQRTMFIRHFYQYAGASSWSAWAQVYPAVYA